MPTILDPELHTPLLNHGLMHLYTPEISVVYGACLELRETIEGDREWLDLNCRHVLPHSYGDVPYEDDWGGRRCWYRDGKLHRGGGLPAEIYADGTQMWYKDGKLHRDGDLPTAIWPNGMQRWYKDGKLHRDNDLPAKIEADGTQEWYKDGELHRDNGRKAQTVHRCGTNTVSSTGTGTSRPLSG